MSAAMQAVAQDVIRHYGFEGASVERFGSGLINETFLVTVAADRQFVLQGLNALFAPEVNADINTVTCHLADKGVPTQRLLPADNGDLWVMAGERAWRMSTYVPGICFDMLTSTAQAAAAGRLLAGFHRNISDLELVLHTERLGVHDTRRHLANLRRALDECRDHRNYKAIAVLADAVFAEASLLPVLPELPDRLVHGDPKISNLVFDEAGQGVCMIDLDTLAHMPLPLEMGDAFRSWCNPRGEDTQRSNFRLDLFAAAVEGYASVGGAFLLPEEWRSFVPATRTIMVELAARFTTDALRERYFGWNPDKFADRSAHNQIRAAGQLELHRSLTGQIDAADAIVHAAFTDS